MSDQGDLNAWIGDRLRQARLAKGFTQTELGDVVGLTRASIANIEVGRQNISAEKLVLLSRHLNVALDELLPPGSTPEEGPMPVDDSARLRIARRRAATAAMALAEEWVNFQAALDELGAARREQREAP